MFVSNGHKAAIDIRKLRDYCLNTNHNYGKHKAYLFASILGMTENNAEELREILLKIIVILAASKKWTLKEPMESLN